MSLRSFLSPRLIACLMMLVPFSVINRLAAQQTFTQYLTRQQAGEGRVILQQDAEIEALVNGVTGYVSPKRLQQTTPLSSSAAKPRLQQPDTTMVALDDSTLVAPGRRMKVNGYRIQVYAGGNNRQSKAEAHRIAALVRSTFDDAVVYTHFISPRWICRVGDFRTYEEAHEYLRRMQQTQKFREASIVKSKVIISY